MSIPRPARAETSRAGRSAADHVFGMLLLLPFAVAFLILTQRFEVSWRAFVYGSGSWGFGCILKMALYHGLIRRLPHDERCLLGVSALNGLVSGLTELGLALVFFLVLKPLTLPEVLAFGIGIGAIEAFLVATTGDPLKGTDLAEPARRLEEVVSSQTGLRGIVYRQILPCLERLIAAALHVGTRGLVYLSRRSGSPVPFLVALGVFVLADGVVGYRLLHEGRLTDLGVLRRTYLVLAGLAVFSLGAFRFFWSGSGTMP